jgi:signal transduction histidine kinase
VVALLRQSHEQASAATITLEGLTGRNVAVLAEPDLLKQIYWNICLNALEAMPGGGRLDIRASRRRDAEASWGVVEFTDSGGGIPPDALARLFDPFFTTKQGGTGLGLSIARKITENLGGTITVDNRPGEGATFRVAIPLAADGHLSAAPTSPAAPAPVAGG